MDVHAIDKIRIGVCKVVGKSWSKSEQCYVLSSEPTEVTCADDQNGAFSMAGDVAHYRKICKQGHLVPADKATADALGLAFKES